MKVWIVQSYADVLAVFSSREGADKFFDTCRIVHGRDAVIEEFELDAEVSD